MTELDYTVLRERLETKKAELTARLERVTENVRRGYHPDSKERAKELEPSPLSLELRNRLSSLTEPRRPAMNDHAVRHVTAEQSTPACHRLQPCCANALALPLEEAADQQKQQDSPGIGVRRREENPYQAPHDPSLAQIRPELKRSRAKL